GHAGWLATEAWIARGPAEIHIPEERFDIERVCDDLKRRHEKGRFASIVVVAEGAEPEEGSMATQSGEVDQFGHVRLGGIANLVAEEIETRTGFETPVTILGHAPRGARPPPSTASSPPASASPPSTPPPTVPSARPPPPRPA